MKATERGQFSREEREMRRIPLQSFSRFQVHIRTRHITVRLDLLIPVALLMYLVWLTQ